MFLAGLREHCESMFDAKRRVASFFLLLSIFLTVLVATRRDLPGAAWILLLLLVVQFTSSTYYMLSYVPFGKELLSSCCSALWAAAKGQVQPAEQTPKPWW